MKAIIMLMSMFGVVGIDGPSVALAADSFTSIDFPGATFSYVTGINDNGVITGTYMNADGRFHAFRLK